MATTTTTKSDSFDEELFETRLESLKDTQDGVQHMSAWCIQQRKFHKRIVFCWLNVFKRVRVEHRLVLFYLANDVIQNSKRKRYEFVESWATALQRATTMVRDEKVKSKILRIFDIWGQRGVYTEEYLSDLSGLLNIKQSKKPQSQPVATPSDASDDFQNMVLINSVRNCVELSEATDKSFKKLPKVPCCDIELIKQQLKDKSHSVEVENDFIRYIAYIETYKKNLQTEIKSRKSVITNLDAALKFYANQRGEVKVVVSAYKNFGARVKLVKKKLDEITPNLPSPIPSPDINAPSPEPDTDLQLPDDQSSISMNLFKNNMNGYASYLDGNLPFDINDFKNDSNTKASSQPIEVIGTRSENESFNSSTDYYKPDSITAYGSGSNVIPGLNSNPVPVPPVQSGYTSLARSAQQYNVMPPLNTNINTSNSLQHENLGSGFASLMSNYSSTDNYHSPNSRIENAPLMPPPSMTISGGVGPSSNANDNFNTTWDMNMYVDHNSGVVPPVSPPNFEQTSHNSEYAEHDNGGLMVGTQDVDHRQLHLPAFNIGVKLGLSTDKSRQLDIDHRNLISLTGSPIVNDCGDKDFRANAGDVDYRTLGGKAIKTIDTIPIPSGVSSMEPPPLSKQSTSPFMNCATGASTESQKEDASSTSQRYDPGDMVIDMDMSDEDIDGIFREVTEQHDTSNLNDDSTRLIINESIVERESEADTVSRPALLETPPEYVSQSSWDADGVSQMSNYPVQNIGVDMQQQQQQKQSWEQMHMAWQQPAPPPPRPPFPLPFQYPNGANVGRGGRGRGWSNSPPTPYRNFTRGSPRGGSPFFNRGTRGGTNGNGIRGTRGKFRGANPWM